MKRIWTTLLLLLLTFSLASLFTGCAVAVVTGGEEQIKSGEKKTGEQEAAPNVAPEQGDKALDKSRWQITDAAVFPGSCWAWL
ncbi:MAG: hypothetical protein AB2448_10165 [Moorella sp. (in: firmicutes)]